MTDEFYVRIGTSLAHKFPDKAVEMAARLAPSNPRVTYIYAISKETGHLDPSHLKALTELFPLDADPDVRTDALAKLGLAWARKEPDAAYRWAALNVTDPKERESVLSEILRVWHARDPEEAMRHIDALGNQDGWAAWPQFGDFKGKQILNHKGVEALRQFLFELPPVQRRLVNFTSLFEGRPAFEKARLLAEIADAQAPATSDDPSDSDNWNRIDEYAVTRALEAWVVESPKESVDWASGQGNESRLLHALTAWAGQDSAAALAEAERLGVADQIRDQLAAKELTRMLESESKIDFPEAYAKERELGRKGFNVPQVIERWMREDPEGAMEVLEKGGWGKTYPRETAERVALIRAIQEL